jgi:TMEM175 potassium channel family protein
MDLGRIVAFTDGVMAVAITLLVLNIEVPDLPSGRESELADELFDLLPSLGAYALAFALVGRYWTIHHRLFENLRAFDGALMTLNLVFLALIALVPFSAELIDRYREEPIAAAVFGATLGFAALVHWAMVRHVMNKEFVRDHERLASEPYGGAIALSLTVVFFLSVPAAFVSTLLAEALWLSTIVLRHPLRRARRRPR